MREQVQVSGAQHWCIGISLVECRLDGDGQRFVGQGPNRLTLEVVARQRTGPRRIAVNAERTRRCDQEGRVVGGRFRPRPRRANLDR